MRSAQIKEKSGFFLLITGSLLVSILGISNAQGATSATNPYSRTNFPKSTQLMSGLTPEMCKLDADYAADISTQPWFYETKLGFPKAENRIPSTGTIHAIMIYVDFLDVAGTDKPQDASADMTTKFSTFIKENSYNKLSFDFTVPNKYFHIQRNSSDYHMDKWNSGDPRSYLEDAIKAADSEVNFSPYDVIYVIPPTGITQIAYGPAFPESGSFAEIADGKRFTSEAVAGSDSRNPKAMLSPWVWMAHETGHLLGMPHPNQNIKSPRPYWDLMTWDNGGPDFYGWSRFVQGWIDDSKVTCITNTAQGKVLVAPINQITEKTNLVIIRESPTKVIVVENRRASTFDKLKASQEGLVVYEVNVDQKVEDIRILQNANKIGGAETGVLKPGENVKFAGRTLKNLGTYKEGDLLSISN